MNDANVNLPGFAASNGRLPRRTSLMQETAAVLKEWIRDETLRDVLPGELELKARLGIGRDTLRLALKLLARDGWFPGESRLARRYR